MTIIAIYIKNLGQKITVMESTLLFAFYSPSLTIILVTNKIIKLDKVYMIMA